MAERPTSDPPATAPTPSPSPPVPRAAGRAPALHQSVFARLVAIMVVMAAALLTMVGGFYFLIVIPGIHTSMDHLVGRHVRAIAKTSPDSAAARALAASLDMEIRYEGPDGAWTTSKDIPTFAELGRLHGKRHIGHLGGQACVYYLVHTSAGGRYVFARSFGERLQEAHSRMLLLLLGVMAAVFLVTYVVIQRSLRPLRLLNEGVTRLSEGQLDVEVRNPTRDEFGVLTHAFNRMARRVKEMVRARDQLLLDVSHELRSPLTRLKVALALLPDDERKTRMAADVAEMESMVTELLELERLRDGRGVAPARQDVVPILREAVERFADRTPGVRFAPAPETVADVDAEKLRTVLRNLLENAIKFSLPDSGAIEVSVGGERDAVVIRIADDGPGIPEADLAGLFEPFFRLDPSRSRKTGGYGLGLSICRRIMEAHGGGISAVNNPGRGATFVLRLPRTAGGG